MKPKARKQLRQRFAAESAASKREALESGRAISLRSAFEYLEKGITRQNVRQPKRASRRTDQRALTTARTATIHIDPDGAILSAVQKSFTKAWRTGKYVGEHFGFKSPAALCRAITPRRWELLSQLQHVDPLEIRALARTLNRRYQGVDDDVAELIRIGLIERIPDNKVWVPFREIRTTFVLRR